MEREQEEASANHTGSNSVGLLLPICSLLLGMRITKDHALNLVFGLVRRGEMRIEIRVALRKCGEH